MPNIYCINGHRFPENCEDPEVVKNRVKLARVEKDLTQAQLGEKAGCTRQTIGLIEAGKFNPSLKLCLAIARSLDKSLDDLFGMEEDGNE
jgi:putative transcriptional regulator